MKSALSVAAIASVLCLTVPVLAQTTTPPPTKSSTAKPVAAKSTTSTTTAHATKGVVKSIDASKMVLSRTKGKGTDRTFVVNDTTARQGDIAVGANVDVRYRTQGAQRVATAISVHQPKPPAATKSTAKSTAK